MSADPQTVVPALLAAAGLSPSAEEVATLVDGYPALLARIDALFAVPGVRYEEPALVYSALLHT